MTKDCIFCPKIQSPQKGFKILSPNPNGVDFQDFLDPSIQSFQPLPVYTVALFYKAEEKMCHQMGGCGGVELGSLHVAAKK